MAACSSPVTDHIGIGEVRDDHIVFAGVDLLNQDIADLRRTHLRLQVIGGHLWGWNEEPVLPFALRVHTAVKEEGHVGIFLRLGDPRLLHPIRGKPLPEGINHELLFKRDFLVRNRLVIVRKADKGHLPALSPVKVFKILTAEDTGELPGAVRAEIEENH